MSLRPRTRFGKYRILRRIASGGFADVYAAYDSVEGIDVAIKVPHERLVRKNALSDFRREVRLSARLDHPNILPIKTAGEVDGQFVIVTPLGHETLRDRYHRRLTSKQLLAITEQILEGLAHAHDHGIAHCDIKPENIIMFKDGRARLADFGIARVAQKTVKASGSGTIGFMAPEQAMGHPSLKSDVFSLGLIIIRMASGRLPEWPYKWPLPEHRRMLDRFSPEFLNFLRKAIAVQAEKRYPNARRMLQAFQRVLPRALATSTSGRQTTKKKQTTRRRTKTRSSSSDWRSVRLRQFQREYRSRLETRCECTKCKGPVSEAMRACPWCGKDRKIHRGETKLPATCPRCRRGAKLDWKYCAWCYGGAIGPTGNRTYTDKRYTRACTNRSCERKLLFPFMRYCPWCRKKVTRRWKIEGSPSRCRSCSGPFVKDYWSFCAWCGKTPKSRR